MANSLEDVFTSTTGREWEDRIVILGGGIVGSSLAYFISHKKPSSSHIILLDASLQSPQGSTAFAPGLVGQLNEIDHLTQMAKESVEEYSKIHGAFQRIGGLEIANSPSGIAQLYHRQMLAQKAHLPAEILMSEEAARIAPDFHAEDKTSKGLFFPSDGTAEPVKIVDYYKTEATAQGVLILDTKASSIQTEVSSTSRIYHISTTMGSISAKTLVLATGIWTPRLIQDLDIDLPIVPVLHPYAHGPSRPTRDLKQPFVRWPEEHIYARDHGDHDGFGSYAHVPLPCTPGKSALENETIDGTVLVSALSVFPNAAQRDSKTPYKELNAMFSVTPDGLPFAGSIAQSPGLFIAAAIWITHAAGVARLVADLVSGVKLGQSDMRILEAFNPVRFEGQDPERLKSQALGTYNNIYNQTTQV